MKYTIVIFALFFTYSCTVSDDPQQDDTMKSDLIGKWLISNSSVYTSFEFNNSNTVLIQKIIDGDSIFFYDEYTLNSGELEFGNEGTAFNIIVSENTISFTLNNGNIVYDLTGNADLSNVLDDKLNPLFTRSWNFEFVNDESFADTDEGGHLFFSLNGTYYFHDLKDSTNSVQRFWNWNTNEDSTFCSSHFPVISCDSDPSSIGVKITILTQDTLKFIDGNDLYILSALD